MDNINDNNNFRKILSSKNVDLKTISPQKYRKSIDLRLASLKEDKKSGGIPGHDVLVFE